MNYIPVTCEQREAMLRAVGVSRIEDLFVDVPAAACLGRDLDLPAGLTEMELVAHVSGLARANAPATELVSFLGAGCYDHYLPSVVDHVLRKPEFFTAYTPYQPEVSQGTLQAIWEFQSMVCALTGAEVANASMYDGATAFVEAALMAARVKKRHTVLVSSGVHPEWRTTLATYAAPGTLEVVDIPLDAEGRTDRAVLASLLDDTSPAALLVASPGFLGVLEDVNGLADVAHAADALLVVAANPILLGVMEPPGVLGADIVVAEGQPLGGAMSFGGPGLGIFACSEKHVRQMPGRLVGRTVDRDGNAAFVLTLSTREQHIRREKATSNICSNHALNALAAGVYLAALGSNGLANTASACISKAHYLRERLLATGRFSAWSDAGFGYEFALAYDGDASAMQVAMLERGFLAGVRVSEAVAGCPTRMQGVDAGLLDRLVLFAVTEKRTRQEIDAFAGEVASL